MQFCNNFYFPKKIRHPKLVKPIIKSIFYCHSNQSRKLCKESESIYQDDLSIIIAKHIQILKSNINVFKEVLIESFAKDKTSELEGEINKLINEIAKHRKSLKSILNMTKPSIKQLSEHSLYEI